MTVIADKTIARMVTELVDLEQSEKVTYEDLISQVNPASLDLTIGMSYRKAKKNDNDIQYGFRHAAEAEKYGSDQYWLKGSMKKGFVLLQPGDVILAVTREFIRMPENMCGQIFTKSTMGRMFINHMMAGYVDPGFTGRLTLELVNDGPHWIRIPYGARVVQLILSKLDQKAVAYEGRYQGAKVVETAKPAGK